MKWMWNNDSEKILISVAILTNGATFLTYGCEICPCDKRVVFRVWITETLTENDVSQVRAWRWERTLAKFFKKNRVEKLLHQLSSSNCTPGHIDTCYLACPSQWWSLGYYVQSGNYKSGRRKGHVNITTDISNIQTRFHGQNLLLF